MARTPEGEAQAAICEYLERRKVFFVRLNNIPAVYRNGNGSLQFRKMGKYAVPGLADILVVKEGRSVFLEVKSDVGRPSSEQIDFGRSVIAAGAEYQIVRSIDDVQKVGL